MQERCVNVQKRGRLSFKKMNEDINKNSDLREAKNHWQSFIDEDAKERDKYLRELEIEFSFNSIVDDKAEGETKDNVAKVFSDRKIENQKKEAHKRILNLKKNLKK